MLKYESKKNSYFQIYNFLSCSAEGIQTVIFLWFIYHVTHSPMFVSLTIVSSYLPSAILGIFLLKKADASNPGKHLFISNVSLSVISLIVYFILLLNAGFGTTTLSIFYLAQAILSVVKMFNKTSQNRIIRTAFSRKDAIKALQLASSGMQAAQVFGAAIGGWAISTGYYMHALMLTCCIYLLNIYISTLFESVHPDNKDEKVIFQIDSVTKKNQSFTYLFRKKDFLLPLVFTVPSSGALQFLNTSLPSLSSLYGNSEHFYPLLNLTLQIAVIISGIAATFNMLSLKTSLRFFLCISGITLILLGLLSGSHFAAYTFLFLTSFFISWHMISIKVLTNQMPDIAHVGKFTMMRNSIASFVKIFFSLSSGLFLTYYSITTTYLILAAILFAFNILWFYQSSNLNYKD
ncbi:MFS transporter (plasmid) [Pantoea vagans]|uniref:MFS transporter n=1 Tax=Pantoea vagans TaxID=470934 RepID=UPI003511E560